MFDITKVAKEVFGTLRSFNYAVALFDADGNKVYQPEDATRFFTDKRNITVSIHEDGENSSLQIYIGKSVDLDAVMGLLDTMRRTSTKFGILFDVRKYHKDVSPKDFAQGNLLEAKSLTGTKKSSYLKLEGAKMIIRHDKAVDEEKQGARGRNVRKIFIENADGERILMPSQNLMAGRAMTRHASKGGAFNDSLGTHITNLATEQAQMRTCVGYCRENKRKLNEDAVPIIEALKGRGKAIRDIFEGLYRRYDKDAPKVSKLAEALVEEVGDDKINAVKTKLQLEDESVIDRPTCESVARVLGESGLLNLEEKKQEMIFLPALGMNVESAAWEAFKADEPKINFLNDTAPDVTPAGDIKAAALTLVANACADDGFANMLSQVAQWLEDGKTDVLLKHIAHRAIYCAKNHSKVDAPKELVKTPSKSKETMIADSVKDGLPVVNESVNELQAWVEGFDADKMFEDDTGSIFPRQMDDGEFANQMDGAADYVVKNFDATDFLVMCGEEFGYGATAADYEHQIDGSHLKAELETYLQGKVEDETPEIEHYDTADIDVSGEIKEVLPKILEKLEAEGYTVTGLDALENDDGELDLDADEDKSVLGDLKFDDRILDEEDLEEWDDPARTGHRSSILGSGTFTTRGGDKSMRGHRGYTGTGSPRAGAASSTAIAAAKPKGHREFQTIQKAVVAKDKPLDEDITEFLGHGGVPEHVMAIAKKLHHMGYEPRIYSGRGMMGAECLGFITAYRSEIEDVVQELDADLHGPNVDAMGKNFIAYWPHLKIAADVPAGEQEEDVETDGLDDDKQVLLSSDLAAEDVLLPANAADDLRREVASSNPDKSDDEDDSQYINRLIGLAGIKRSTGSDKPQP